MCFFIYKMDYKILLVQLTSGNGHHRKFLQDERFYLGYILHTFDQNPYVLVAVYTVLILLINNVYWSYEPYNCGSLHFLYSIFMVSYQNLVKK